MIRWFTIKGLPQMKNTLFYIHSDDVSSVMNSRWDIRKQGKGEVSCDIP